MDKDALHKELDLIQGCIARMANNSFLLKGWAISIITVVIALVGEKLEPAFLCAISLIPLLGFWYLDAFYLRNERMYRKMYEWVIQKRTNGDTTYLYDLNPLRFENLVESLTKTMFSITLRFFFGIPTLIAFGVIIFRAFQKFG